MKKTALRQTVSASMIFAGLLVVGCESTDKDAMYEESRPDVSTDAILANLTPELYTLTDTRKAADADLMMTWQTNWRMMYEDWARALYIDRPSRLNPRPIPGVR